MGAVTIDEAQANLKDLIGKMKLGEGVVITDNGKPVAKIVGTAKRERQCGTLKGTVLYMSPDFNAPLEDFKDYM